MALRPEYKSVRVALLHRDPLPTLDAAVKEILFEETRLGLIKSPSSEVALATTRPRFPSGLSFCKNCRNTGHIFANCPTVECRYCHGHGHILENFPTRPPRPKGNPTKFKSYSKPGSSSIAAAVHSNESSILTVSDLEALLKQVISPSSSSSTALSVTSGNSWLFDSACCNHMTSQISLLSNTSPIHSLPSIQTTNGSCMPITHIGTVATSNLSLFDTYFVPSLALNLVSVGQLCDLGLIVLFSPHGF